MIKINDSFVSKLKPPLSGNFIHWDTQYKGFGIRITASSYKSFVFKYILNGKKRVYTIGSNMATTFAKERYKKLMLDVLNGIDPAKEKQNIINSPYLKDLIFTYLEDIKSHLKIKTYNEYKRWIEYDILPYFKKTKLIDITKNQIQSFHLLFVEKKHTGNRCLGILSSFFNWCIDKDLLNINFAKGIKKYKENFRDKMLNEIEVKSILNHLKQCNSINSYAIYLLLLTGARKGELLQAKWSEFDLEKGYWNKPATNTKQKKVHYIPLNSSALEVLNRLKEISNSIYLFYNPSTKTHIKDIKRYWNNLLKETDLQDIRIHDLRHYFASMLINSGEDLYTVGKLIGHSNIQTTTRYAHLQNHRLERASEKVSNYLEGFN
ncbi:MAG: site-specific integrase [Flavobacteriales bacterium]|nr:MAG: site-specific integrase [Flavobacteriales bacterium]